MKNRKLALIAATAILASGCASTAVSPSAATPVPSERLAGFQQRIDNGAIMVVTRDGGWAGSACYLEVRIDGTLATKIAATETARFYVEPGERLLRVATDPQGEGLCSLAGYTVTRETLLKSGQTKYFRIMFDPTGSMDIQRSDAS